MPDKEKHRALFMNIGGRKLSVVFHSLFSAWMLAFLYEGQIFYALAGRFNVSPYGILFGGMASLLAGAFLCGFIIKTKKNAKKLFLFSYIVFILTSTAFFFTPSLLWIIGIIVSSFLAGCCVAAWGFFLKSYTTKNERFKTIADMLILSNILMVALNMTAIHISPYVGLMLSMAMLIGAFVLAFHLPVGNDITLPVKDKPEVRTVGIVKPMVFLCIFVSIITINSGLMYQVINPAFAHLESLTSWYWALPYIVALIIIRNLPRRINRSYILYVGIAMIGLSFIFFMGLKPTVISYLIVNMLMLGAFGVYDLFWWSILGEMLEFHNNPAKILGIGLSANLLGILLGEIIGKAVTTDDMNITNPTLLALIVVCVTLTILPLLNKHLAGLLKDNVFLTGFSEISEEKQAVRNDHSKEFEQLTERESQVASLLLQGKTYKKIAAELYISENTVKYYVKGIYSKFNIKSRAELIEIKQNK